MNKRRAILKKRLRANTQARYTVERCALFRVTDLGALTRLLQTNNKSFRSECQNPAFHEWVDLTKPHKPRNIQDPRGLTERLHYRLCELLDRVIKPDFLHSATRRRSSVTNARRHVSDMPCVTTDMRNFYESTTTSQVEAFFRDGLQMASDLALKLARLCTIHGHLPTGSPLSPSLSYWVHHRTFDRIHDLSLAVGVDMTLYVDDLTFSGLHASMRFLHRIKSILKNTGLQTHKDKSFGTKQFKHITGAAVNAHGTHVPNIRMKRIVQIIDEIACRDDLEPSRRRSLVGQIAAASAVSPATGSALRYRQMRNIRTAGS